MSLPQLVEVACVIYYQYKSVKIKVASNNAYQFCLTSGQIDGGLATYISSDIEKKNTKKKKHVYGAFFFDCDLLKL